MQVCGYGSGNLRKNFGRNGILVWSGCGWMTAYYVPAGSDAYRVQVECLCDLVVAVLYPDSSPVLGYMRLSFNT